MEFLETKKKESQLNDFPFFNYFGALNDAQHN